MAQWRIKEISDVTKVSVRMLHHYDKIGLLKPSVRSSNSYRWYTEQDLARLQQIIALKFFGFSLSQIKTMLQKKQDLREQLLIQEQMITEQTAYLHQAKDALTVVLQQCASSKNPNWNDLITLIERYHMTQELKNTWAGKVLSPKQQDRYLAFKHAYPKEVGAWEGIIEAINNKQFGNPEEKDGEHAINIFKQYTTVLAAWEKVQMPIKMTPDDASEVLDLVNKFKTEGLPLSQEGNIWFTQAMLTHQLRCWEKLHKDISKNLETEPSSAAGKKLATQWRKLLSEHCMGGSIEFFFGMNLIIQAAQAKSALAASADPHGPNKTETVEALKLLRDPLAINWIEKALKAS